MRVRALLGAMTAAWLGRFVQALLIGIGPRDPVTFAGVLAVIAAASAAAWAIPTRRALKVDPVEVLRQS
jgi:ABC-type antimicrobial peptide transport system permease subunit